MTEETKKAEALIEELAGHFGYDAKTMPPCVGNWPREKAMEYLTRLSEVLDENRKFRVTVDYDPEFPRVLLQISYED
ncbi:MAG: hypothetical protein LUG45_05415 [Clostridiales bacterium]|nr:hypothetical protein [Clostridiales bacterium]